MSHPDQDTDLIETFHRLTEAWIGGDFDLLHRHYDPDIVFGDTGVLTYYFQTRRTLPGGSRWEFSGKETLVFLRRDRLWKLAHWHFSIDPASDRRMGPADEAGNGS
jgi:ketosteroid isomerase-like protein